LWQGLSGIGKGKEMNFLLWFVLIMSIGLLVPFLAAAVFAVLDYLKGFKNEHR